MRSAIITAVICIGSCYALSVTSEIQARATERIVLSMQGDVTVAINRPVSSISVCVVREDPFAAGVFSKGIKDDALICTISQGKVLFQGEFKGVIKCATKKSSQLPIVISVKSRDGVVMNSGKYIVIGRPL